MIAISPTPLLPAWLITMDEMDEVIKEFLVESYESLDQLDRDLLAIEETPNDRERLGAIFRTVHTIKGTSGFLGFPTLERVAHVGENLLVLLRDGEMTLNGEIAGALLGMVDAIREILGNIEANSIEGDVDFSQLICKLESLLNPSNNEAKEAVGETAETTAKVEVNGAESIEQPEDETAATESTNELAPEEAVVDFAPPRSVQPALPTASVNDKKPTEPSDKTASVADATVRIDVELLDDLMNLVGELVLARNQIVQYSSGIEDASMVAASQRLNLITTELQEGVMKTRMQPIRNAWSKLPRVVRDLSTSIGKSVELKMEGAETELDKTILEAIRDPLTHIVRNSVDHGIESPDVRQTRGKSPEGTLLLRAFHEGGQVVIEIADDGGGIDPQRVRQKAIENQIITAAQAASMSERELVNLVLLPGFSTAKEVTNVSGRGVGMDVVKTNIERIGGTLDIQTVQGEGTTLRIKIPLTLAIVPALIVRSGCGQYAIPQVSLQELVRLKGEKASDAIEYIHDAPVYRLRERLLPLVYLDEQLETREKRVEKQDSEGVYIVVLQAEDRQFGLVVDAVTDTQEIVVKPLGSQLKNLCIYAGATIMGDGSVVLILDVNGLARKSCVLAENHDHQVSEQMSETMESRGERESLLLVDPGDGTRAAIRLSSVARLEEFDREALETCSMREVVQYRGEIMPIVHLMGGSVHDRLDSAHTGRLHVVVHKNESHNVGVAVGKVVDIIRHHVRENDLESGACILPEGITPIHDLDRFFETIGL